MVSVVERAGAIVSPVRVTVLSLSILGQLYRATRKVAEKVEGFAEGVLGRPGECARRIHHGRFIAGVKGSDCMLTFGWLFVKVEHRQARGRRWTLALAWAKEKVGPLVSADHHMNVGHCHTTISSKAHKMYVVLTNYVQWVCCNRLHPFTRHGSAS